MRLRKQCQASVRYMAPVSTYTKPSFLATNLALVLLPLALVPSMAMTIGDLVSMLIAAGTADEKGNAPDRDNRDCNGNANEQQTESHLEWPAAEVNRRDCCFSFRSDAIREFSGRRFTGAERFCAGNAARRQSDFEQKLEFRPASR